jgi:hypothetical protein
VDPAPWWLEDHEYLYGLSEPTGRADALGLYSDDRVSDSGKALLDSFKHRLYDYKRDRACIEGIRDEVRETGPFGTIVRRTVL